MLYANYVRNKMRHLYKTAEAEGVPCILKYSKGKYMKDYEIYGNSMQGKNLIPYPFYQETKTINGVTFTNNGNGTITANGTATANAIYYLYYNSTEQTRMNISDIAIISGCPESETTNYGVSFDIYYEDGSRHYYTDYGYSDTPNISAEKGKLNSCYILVKSGVTVENLIFKPQLEIGSTATEWQSPVVSPENPVEIQSVGDLTKNLVPYPYFFTTKTINGVTFTDNGDGSITVDGTATANAVFYLVDRESNYTLDKCGLKIGDSYTISKTSISGDDLANIYFTANYYDENNTMKQGEVASSRNTATATIKSDFKSWGIYLVVIKDKTVNNTTIKVQLEKGSSATEYEPYNKYDIPITVAGKNLILYPYSDSTKTLYGITFTDNNGIITLDGTTTLSETGVVDFRLMFNAKLEAGTYTLSGCPKTGGTYTYRLFVNITHDDNTYTYVNEIGNGSTFTVTNTDLVTINIRIGGQLGTVSNLVFKPQLEKGLSATEYESYHEPSTTHIYLDEPLRKVGDYSDYVDFKKQKVVRNIKEITFENTVFNEYTYGTEFDNTYHFNIRDMGCVYTSPMLCNIMKAGNISMNATVNDTFFTSNYSNAANGGIYLQIEKSLIDDYSGESNAEKLKAFLINKNAKLLYCTTGYSEESISLPTLQTFKDTTIMSVDTMVLPNNIKATYIRT